MKGVEITLPKGAEMLINRLNQNGYEAFVVGGCVRDTLMGKSPNDWDITTSACPEQVKEALSDIHIIDTGIKHGTVTAVLEQNYEITTFRVDGGYSDGRHPDSVSFSSRLEDDLSRRDFTVNAMAYSPKTGLVDIFGGADDLENKIIRCVGDPDRRFDEDHLRILRAARFQSQLGFSIDEKTGKSMAESAPKLQRISKERIASEFCKLIAGKHCVRAIRDNIQVILQVIPELGASIGCYQNSSYHFADVYDHTLAALEAASAQEQALPKEWSDEKVRLALFFHDIGKPAAKTTDESGKDHFIGHSGISAEITYTVLKRLKLSNKLIEDVVWLVLHHEDKLVPTKPAILRRLRGVEKEQLLRLMKVQECDLMAHTDIAKDGLCDLFKFKELLEKTESEAAVISLKDLKISGRELLAEGFEPGKRLGRVLEGLLNDVIEEKTPNEPKALLARARELWVNQ